MTKDNGPLDDLIYTITQGMHESNVHLTDQIIEGLRRELAEAQHRLALIDGIVMDAEVIDRTTQRRIAAAMFGSVNVPQVSW